MLYKVSDIELDYPQPGDEVIGTVEAASPEEAIIAALKAISPSMQTFVSDAVHNYREDFETHVLPAFKVEIA